jgi:hypothetical protein
MAAILIGPLVKKYNPQLIIANRWSVTNTDYHFHQLYEAGRVVKEIAGFVLTTNTNRIRLGGNYRVGATIVRTVVGNFITGW